MNDKTNGTKPNGAPAVNGGAYPIEDHTFDVVVVGAGGVRPARGRRLRARRDCGPPASPRCFRPARIRSRRRAASRHRSAIWARTTGAGTCTTPSRARTGSATRTRSNIMVRNAPEAVYELEHWGLPFSRTEDGKIYQRPFGGMTTDFGKGIAQRTCAAADRTGHAMLHTLYSQSLRYSAEFFIEYFAIDLIMDEEGRCRRRDRAQARRRLDPSLPLKHDHPGDRRLWPRLFLRDLGAYLHRRRQRHGAARRPAAAGHGIRAIPSDRHLRRRLPDHRRRARRRRLSRQFRGRALHGALCAVGQGSRLARRGLALDDDRNPRGPRRRQEQGSHLSCTSIISTPEVLHERLPGISETARIFAGVDLTKEPIPVLPTVHYNMGGIPTNFHGEVLTKKNGNPDTVVPGLMAIGEAACVSVHGANRLGSNSLIDLVVFGRAAAERCSQTVEKNGKHAGPAEGFGRSVALAARQIPQCQWQHADRRAAAQDAEGHADQLRGVPHRRDARGRPQADSRGLQRHAGRRMSPTAR